ncbi:uncharacterized protein LOC129585476 [Paramacrobiotus metropolitanus]|uniref:uncharacterized protein LOC129585476 n=1 Tax=Paramacrobiotus metropolitanus TaxID=2943436 RepID=UPI002445A377|nr:uncharacterized protein LOC129585476 [Paramacrobiotus metropolitanus]
MESGVSGCQSAEKLLVDVRDCRPLIHECIYKGRYYLAMTMVEALLDSYQMDPDLTQDNWLWRMLLIVLVNVKEKDTDRCYRILRSVVDAGKAREHGREEQLIACYFVLRNFGREKVALKLLNERQAAIAVPSVLPSEAPDICTRLSVEWRARLQMLRVMSNCWRAPEEPDADAGLELYLPPGADSPEDIHLPALATDGTVPGLSDFLNMSASRLRELDMSAMTEMFACFIQATDVDDQFVVFLSQILQMADKIETLLTVLSRYAERHPDLPWAAAHLVEVYVHYFPRDVQRRWPHVTRLAQLDPFGRSVNLYCWDFHYMGKYDTGYDTEALEILCNALCQEHYRFSHRCWKVLARILRRADLSNEELKDALCDAMMDAEDWWTQYHFQSVTVPRALQLPAKIKQRVLLYKTEVCIALIGKGSEFERAAVERLNATRVAQLNSHREKLRHCHDGVSRRLRERTKERNLANLVKPVKFPGPDEDESGAEPKLDDTLPPSTSQYKMIRPEAAQPASSTRKRGRPASQTLSARKRR